jgi:hypothetical protein
MGNVLLQLLPVIAGSMLMPTWILLVLSLLQSAHGRLGALAFVGGVTTVRLLQILLFSYFISAADVAAKVNEAGIITSTVLVVAGILLWAMALKQVYAGDEDEALLAKWMTMLTLLTPVRAFGLGVLLVTTSIGAWLFILAAIGVIEQAQLSLAQNLVAFLFYLVGASALLIAPILVTMWAPARFDVLAQWLQARERHITIVVSLVVGSLFLWYGVSGLIG